LITKDDQWTVYSSVRPYGPFWKYTWPNGQETYVSRSTGDVVQDTTRGSRILEEMVEGLTRRVREIEATEGLLSDWSLPGEIPTGAAYDFAQTVCRRTQPVRVLDGNEVRLIQSSFAGRRQRSLQMQFRSVSGIS
jgi:hypothetical protein